MIPNLDFERAAKRMEDRFEKEDAEENEEEPSPETITINGEDVGDEKKTKTE